MYKYLLFFFLSAALISCVSKPAKPLTDKAGLKLQMIEADRAFSKMSEIKGMKSAFMEYIDSNGVLLRPNSMPITGGDAIYHISQSNDSSFILTWEPRGGNIAESGELGYTYGIYSIKVKATEKVSFGNYVTIWKRHLDGKWKFMLDTGNEGIGDEE